MRLPNFLMLSAVLALSACAEPNTTAEDLPPPSPEVIEQIVAEAHRARFGREPEGLVVDPVQTAKLFRDTTDYFVCFRTTEWSLGPIFATDPDGSNLRKTHEEGDPYLQMSFVVVLRRYDHGWGGGAYKRVVDTQSSGYDPLNTTGKLGRIKTTNLCPLSTPI